MNEQQEELCLRDKDAYENWFEKRIKVLTVENVKSFESKQSRSMSEQRSKQQIKEEEASWEMTSRLEYVIAGFTAW